MKPLCNVALLLTTLAAVHGQETLTLLPRQENQLVCYHLDPY